MKYTRQEFVYMVEPLDTGWAAYKATYGTRGELERELLAAFVYEKEAEELIRDIIDRNQKVRKIEEKRQSDEKRKEAEKSAVLLDKSEPDDKVLLSQSGETNGESHEQERTSQGCQEN